MKYKYNNEWKELNVKVSDTLPIGSIVEYDGETVPTGYEEVVDSGSNMKIKKVYQSAAYPSEVGKSIKIYRDSSYGMASDERYGINFNAIEYNTSTQLSKNSIGILIGKNIHTVLVIGQWTALDSNGETRSTYILKNNVTCSENFVKYNTVCATSVAIPVQEGDFISLQGFQSSGAVKNVEGEKSLTFLQVIVLD